jgi:hypothetical protein
MPMKYLFILLSIPVIASSQEITTLTTTVPPNVAMFKNILRKSANEYVNDTTIAIRYPIVITSNDTIADNINKQIKHNVFSAVFKDITGKQDIDLLDSFITIGLNKMSYKTTFNGNGILSLTINYQSCGSVNCTDTSVILNFDIATGKPLAIEDVISKDNIDLFMKGVQVDKSTALNKYKVDLKNQLDDEDITKVDYTAAIDNVNNNCLTSVQIKNFILTETGIEILDDCEFPQSLDEIKPSYHIIYPYSAIKSLLNKDFSDKVL